MTGARVRGDQQEEGKYCFSVSLREYNIPFRLGSEYIQSATHNFLLYFIQNIAA